VRDADGRVEERIADGSVLLKLALPRSTGASE
jgi:hypothetical protein